MSASRESGAAAWTGRVCHSAVRQCRYSGASLQPGQHQPPAALPHWPSLESCGSFPAAAAAAAGELSRSLHFQPFPRFRGTGRGQAAVWTHTFYIHNPPPGTLLHCSRCAVTPQPGLGPDLSMTVTSAAFLPTLYHSREL